MARGVAAAGVIGRVQLRNNLLEFTKIALEKKRSEVRDAALIAGIIAKNTGQNTIMTTPSSISPSKPDRYWTGAMFRAFDAEVTERGNKITVKYGWIRGKRSYFKTQEYGGFFLGKTITPMHALVNAKVASEDYLKSKGLK